MKDYPRGSKKGAKCETRYCRHLKPRHTNGGFLSICWKCKSRKQRGTAAYSLNIIRARAKRKGIEFKLTIGEFKKWCETTGYLLFRGTNKTSMTVGRINHALGYEIGNIEPQAHSLNSALQHYVPDYYKAEASKWCV